MLSYPKLATVLTRIEAVINSRLLTTVSDLRDLTPTKPTHLALGRSLFSLPDIAGEVSANEGTTMDDRICKNENETFNVFSPFLTALARRVPALVISQI